MNTSIGGMFALQREGLPENGNGLLVLKQPSLLMVNARSALWLLARQLKPRKVWLPSFLCPSMISAIEKAEIAFYPISKTLEVSSTSWLDDLDQSDLVVFIDYFGFPVNPLIMNMAKRKGATVVRDASQSLLSLSTNEADFTVYSPRKFFGVPDGGILVSEKHALDIVDQLNPPPQHWWKTAVHAGELRRRFDLEGEENLWFSVFQDAESKSPIGPYRMSRLSENLLREHVDYDVSGQQRKDNYRYLASHLGNEAIYPILPDMVVPLGFPVCIPDRDQVRNHLIENKVFPPIHWELGSTVPKTFSQSHQLSKSIMTLPCDQRYNVKHMQRVIYHFQNGRSI